MANDAHQSIRFLPHIRHAEVLSPSIRIPNGSRSLLIAPLHGDGDGEVGVQLKTTEISGMFLTINSYPKRRENRCLGQKKVNMKSFTILVLGRVIGNSYVNNFPFPYLSHYLGHSRVFYVHLLLGLAQQRQLVRYLHDLAGEGEVARRSSCRGRSLRARLSEAG